MGIENIILYLVIYSFLGWCCEVIYCSVGQGRFVNRGFLNGPFCPIYGFGAVLVLLGLNDFPSTVAGIFAGGFIITSALEYFTSWSMEKLFNNKWWDYSNRRFNINGRVCLLNSTLFGMLCLILYFDIHPKINAIIAPLSESSKTNIIIVIATYFAIDFAITLRTVLGINSRMKNISVIKSTIVNEFEHFSGNEKIKELQLKIAKHNLTNLYTKDLERYLSDKKFLEGRILKAFPHLKSKRLDEHIKDIIED